MLRLVIAMGVPAYVFTLACLWAAFTPVSQ